MKRLLIFIVGVGAGNTTRNLALLESLKSEAPGLDIHFAAQGRAADLLEDVATVHRMKEISYGDGGAMSATNIITSNLTFPVRFFENRAIAKDLIRALTPDLILADSDFYCLGPAKGLGYPLVSLNNAAAIVAALKRDGIPGGCGFSGRIIEPIDAWLQRRYPDRVICPVLQRDESLPEKYIQIPPIVRPDATPSDEIGEDVVVVTGGSGIGVGDIDLRDVKAPLVTFGAKINHVPAHADQRGFTLDALDKMRRAKVLVVQGGFSSVSEAVALRRPTVVVPITGHAEQHINATQFENLGLGLAASAPQAAKRINEVLTRFAEFNSKCQRHGIATDGAEVAAKALAGMLG